MPKRVASGERMKNRWGKCHKAMQEANFPLSEESFEYVKLRHSMGIQLLTLKTILCTAHHATKSAREKEYMLRSPAARADSVASPRRRASGMPSTVNSSSNRGVDTLPEF